MGVCYNGRTLIRKSIQDSEGKGTHTHTQKEEEASETISNLILLYPRRKARVLGEMSKKEGGEKRRKTDERERRSIKSI
jgi:hypothetical protein